MCPYFDELDEIFGTKISMKPPFIHDSLDSLLDLEEEPHVHDSEAVSVSSIAEIIDEEVVLPVASTKTSKTYKERKNSVVSGMTALAETAQLRFAIQKEEVELSKLKWEDEKERRSSEYNLQMQKFQFKKEVTERRLQLEEKKLENQLELEKFKLEIEMKTKIELAKLQHL